MNIKISAGNESQMRRQVLVAPAHANIPRVFETVRAQPGQRQFFVDQMQRLRGEIYLRDGAIQSAQLTSDGRHHSDADACSWHLLSLDEQNDVVGCVRFLVHSNTVAFDRLTLSRSALARSSEWGQKLRSCIESELRRARVLNMPFAEVGGWALADKVRHSTEAVKLALGAFAWGQLIGGALGVTTATMRNHSACILSRIGGKSLWYQGSELPAYFDPQYGCTMAILRFDAFSCTPKYQAMVAELTRQLASVPVYADPVPELIRVVSPRPARVPRVPAAAYWPALPAAVRSQPA